jgi:hypothetical protein
MKNHQSLLYLDEPDRKVRFLNWLRWVDRLPVLSTVALPVRPRVNIERDERVQAYLNALRDTGAAPLLEPAPRATKPTQG